MDVINERKITFLACKYPCVNILLTILGKYKYNIEINIWVYIYMSQRIFFLLRNNTLTEYPSASLLVSLKGFNLGNTLVILYINISLDFFGGNRKALL